MTTNAQDINLQKTVKPYCKADAKKSWGQVANTLIPLFLCYIAAFTLYDFHWALSLPFTLVAGLLTTRTFIIMHDCGHGSFFKERKTRDLLGVITGILTFTPYHQWTREHAAHHQHSGDLDYRGRGDVWTMTLAEYEQANWLDRLKYYLYRHPLITFGIGPVYLFQFRHRFTLKTDRGVEKRNVYFTNIVLASILVALISTMGWAKVLFVLGTTVGTAQLLGCLLFYVQHQYEEVYWSKGQAWDYNTAALEGCSYLELPKVLQWFTGNIGFHHIHHLNHKVPNYNLEQCHKENGVFHNVATLTMKDIFYCIRLKIYDERSGKMMTWSQVRAYEKALQTGSSVA
jgi:omega-6 fatty acid desaturase (delta-12 desaturase)